MTFLNATAALLGRRRHHADRRIAAQHGVSSATAES